MIISFAYHSLEAHRNLTSPGFLTRTVRARLLLLSVSSSKYSVCGIDRQPRKEDDSDGLTVPPLVIHKMNFAVSNPDLQPISALTHTPGPERAGHSVQLYTDDAFLIDVLVRFIGGAIAAGDSAVVIATKAHRLELEQRLYTNGVDFSTAARQGRYLTLDAHETLPKIMVNGVVDEILFENAIVPVLKQARSSMRGVERPIAVFGELVALLWADNKPLKPSGLNNSGMVWLRAIRSPCFAPIPTSGFAHGKDIEPFLKMCGEHSSVFPARVIWVWRMKSSGCAVSPSCNRRPRCSKKSWPSANEERLSACWWKRYKTMPSSCWIPRQSQQLECGCGTHQGIQSPGDPGKTLLLFLSRRRCAKRQATLGIGYRRERRRFEDEGWRLRKDGTSFGRT